MALWTATHCNTLQHTATHCNTLVVVWSPAAAVAVLWRPSAIYGLQDSFDRISCIWYKYLRLQLWFCRWPQRFVAAACIDCRSLLMALFTECGFYGTHTCSCCCEGLHRYVAATCIDYCRALLMALLMALLTKCGLYGTNTCGCCCAFVEGRSNVLLQHI